MSVADDEGQERGREMHRCFGITAENIKKSVLCAEALREALFEIA
jgi:hypothetical protein